MKPMRLTRLFVIPLAAAMLVGIGVVVGLLASNDAMSYPGGALEVQPADGGGGAQPSGEAPSDNPASASCTIYWQDRGAAIPRHERGCSRELRELC